MAAASRSDIALSCFGCPYLPLGYTVATSREGRRGAIPAHSSINVGVAFVVTYVTLQPQVFRPCPPVPTVMRGQAQTFQVQFRDGRSNMVWNLQITLPSCNHGEVVNGLPHRSERTKLFAIFWLGQRGLSMSRRQ